MMKMMKISDITMHSGGADGSDTKWELIGREFGLDKVNHYYHGDVTPRGNFPITDEDYQEGIEKATIAARQMGRIGPTHTVRSSLIIRNWCQVKYAKAIFAIGLFIASGTDLKYGKKSLITQVKGGTGYAVQMAINEGKPVYVFDYRTNSWITYSEVGWHALSEPPTLTEHFAGIGTRQITSRDEEAIRRVYETTERRINY